MGNGNVGIDIVRLLANSADELDGTDLGPIPTAWLTAGHIETIDVVGRSSASHAKFDPVMVKELHRLAHATIKV